MQRSIFKIIFLKNEDGSFKESVDISGTEIETLGMIEKEKLILDDTKEKIIASIFSKNKTIRKEN